MGERIPVRDNIASLLEAVGDAVTALDPQRSALVHGDRRRTWREFDDRASRLAGYLAAAGIGRGDRVGIGLHNSPEYLESVLAVLKLRAVPVNINYRYREAELAEVVELADVRALVVDDALVGPVEAVAPRVPQLRSALVAGGDAAEAPADGVLAGYEWAMSAAEPLPRQERSADDQILMLTGGTTGAPKGVVWDNGGICGVGSSAYKRAGIPVPTDRAEVVAAAEAAVRDGSAPVLLPASPLMHGTGFFFSVGNLLRGGTVVTLPQRGLDPKALWSAVQEHRVVELGIVGDAFAVPLLAELERAAAAGEPYDLTALRRVVSSGVRWSQENKRRLLRAGRFTVQDSIASTEGGPYGTSLAGPDPDSVPAEFTLPPNARVLAPDGTDVVPGSGQVGELASTGSLPLGYLNDPELTAKIFRTIDGVRYAVPGDSAVLEADGTLRFLGRGSGIINTGGEKVFAEEVEQVLVEHPGVAEAAVVGVPDPRWGSQVTALVVPSGGAELTAGELADHVGRRLAGYKRPRSISVVPDLQRTASGKIDRRWAQEQAEQLFPPPAGDG